MSGRRRFERVRITYVHGPSNAPTFTQERDLGRVNVNATGDELFADVFDEVYNYHVCLVARGGGVPDLELRVTRDTNLLRVLEMHSLHGDVEVRAIHDTRRVCVYGTANDFRTDEKNAKYWQHAERVCVHVPVGEVLKPVFDQYKHVSVKHRVPFGVLEHTLAKHTTLKTVIEELGLHEGDIEVYAKNQ